MKKPFDRYVDPTGEFTNRELQLGGWYVRHKLQMRNILIGVLIAWSVITLGFSLFVIGEYTFIGLWKDRDQRIAQTVQFSENAVLQPLYQAQPLEIRDTDILTSGPGRYDMVTAVRNKNPEFVADVFFHYEHAGGKTASSSAMVLPGQRQLLAELGVERTGRPTGVKLIVDQIGWQRVNPHVIADPIAYTNLRIAFVTENTEIGSADGIDRRVAFDLVNDTVYSYWSADFYVELLRGEALIGVLPLSVPNLRSGEVRRIDLRPLFEVRDALSIRLVPRINIFNPDVYMPIGT